MEVISGELNRQTPENAGGTLSMQFIRFVR